MTRSDRRNRNPRESLTAPGAHTRGGRCRPGWPTTNVARLSGKHNLRRESLRRRNQGDPVFRRAFRAPVDRRHGGEVDRPDTHDLDRAVPTRFDLDRLRNEHLACGAAPLHRQHERRLQKRPGNRDRGALSKARAGGRGEPNPGFRLRRRGRRSRRGGGGASSRAGGPSRRHTQRPATRRIRRQITDSAPLQLDVDDASRFAGSTSTHCHWSNRSSPPPSNAMRSRSPWALLPWIRIGSRAGPFRTRALDVEVRRERPGPHAGARPQIHRLDRTAGGRGRRPARNRASKAGPGRGVRRRLVVPAARLAKP